MTPTEFVEEFERFSGLDLPDDVELVDTAVGTGPDYTLELSYVVPADTADALIEATGFAAELMVPGVHPLRPVAVDALAEDPLPPNTRGGHEMFEIDDDGRRRTRTRMATVIELGDGDAQVILRATSAP